MLGFNDLTLKAQAFVFSFLIGLFSLNAIAQQMDVVVDDNKTVTVDARQLEDAAADLEQESQKHNGKVKRSLKKIGKKFKELAEKLKRDKDAPRKKVTLKRILLGAGKGATFVSVQVSRPFVNVAGFFKGFFERPNKNIDEVQLMTFFLKYEDRFNDIWQEFNPRLESSELEKIQIAFMERVDGILNEKKEAITKDMTAYFMKNPSEFSEQAVLDFVNSHPEFQDLIPVIGRLETTDIESLEDIQLGIDPMQALQAARITLTEGVSFYAMKTFVPKMILSIVSKSLGGAVFGIGLAADAGMITSALMCTMNKKLQSNIDNGDQELKEFCQYVVNKSAYQISKSRLKGYVNGKEFRRKFIRKSEKIKRKIQKKLKKKDDNTLANNQ